MVSVSSSPSVTPFLPDHQASEYPPSRRITNTRPAFSSRVPFTTATYVGNITQKSMKMDTIAIYVSCGAAGLVILFIVSLFVLRHKRKGNSQLSQLRATTANQKSSLSTITLDKPRPPSDVKCDLRDEESNYVSSLPNIPPVKLPTVTRQPEIQFRSETALNTLEQPDSGLSIFDSITSSSSCYTSRYAPLSTHSSRQKLALNSQSASLDSGIDSEHSLTLNPNITLGNLQEMFRRVIGNQTLTQQIVEKFCSQINSFDLTINCCYHVSLDFSISLIDQRGGNITFSADDKFMLSIPCDAVDKPILIWSFCEYNVDDGIYMMTPIVNCGPDGLVFMKPAVLTVPHCSTSHELLEAVNQQTSDDDWAGNHVIKQDEETITMSVPHFTRLGARIPTSRIPVMSKKKAGSRAIGKRLLMTVYKEDQKLRAYFVNDIQVIIKRVEKNESMFASRPLSPWKPFLFYLKLGGLKISIQPGKTVAYRDETILAHQYDYCEQLMSSPVPYIVEIYQPDNAQQTFSITHTAQPEIYPHYLQRVSTQAYTQSHYSQPTNNSTQQLAPFRVPTEQSDPSLYREQIYSISEPQESCTCLNACNCVELQNDFSDTPTPPQTFTRSRYRVSRDSGYDSPMSPGDQPLQLHGPISLPTNTVHHNIDVDISFDGLTLTDRLDTE